MLSNRPVSHNAIRRVSFHYFDCKDVNFQLIILGHGRYSQGSVLIQKFYQMFKDVDVRVIVFHSGECAMREYADVLTCPIV